MPESANLPLVPQSLLDEWIKVQNAIGRFRAIAHMEQIACPHTHAVQYNPKETRYGFSDGYSKRCCIACGLTETAEARWDTDGFEEYQSLYGAEIVDVSDIGASFNHYTLPGIVEFEPGLHDARLDALNRKQEAETDDQG